MKRIVAFALLFCTILCNAQISCELKVNFESSIGGASKGEALITGVHYGNLSAGSIYKGYFIDLVQKDKESSISCYDAPKRMSITPLDNSIQSFWDVQNILSLPSLSKLNDLYATRADIEEDVMSYVSNLEQYGYTFDDPYLLSYLYSVVSRIAPQRRFDGFPYNLNIIIVNDDSMNACVFPNGTLMINTGLLANLHTEDELVGVLAHEIGHFAANHVLVNIQKKEQRQKRAEAWAAFATVMAAGAEVYMASRDYYVDGSLTAATAVLSSTIAANAIADMGVEFNKEQETDADEMAVKALELLGYDKCALSTAFSRMVDVFNEEGNWAQYYISSDHPSFADRISKCGTPHKEIVDKDFEKKVSFVVTNMAVSKYNYGRFSQALKYVNQNIANGVATDDDYLIKANCLMNLQDTPASNSEAVSLIRKAKEINPDNINIIKAEIMASIRLKNKNEANSLIEEYKGILKDSMADVEYGSNSYNAFYNEYDWARKMGIKVKSIL